jgi:Flp pilus assembly protein TadG
MVRAARKIRAWRRRFAQARDGATAVEFALIAAPFLALMFGVLELGMVFMVSTTLDNATESAARKIRTGEFQMAGGGSASTFRDAICADMTWLGSTCASKLQVDVRTFPRFADVSLTDPVTDGAFDSSKTTFVPGDGEDIVVVRAYYEWTLITPMMNAGLASLGGTKRLIYSTVTFRNEPFET